MSVCREIDLQAGTVRTLDLSSVPASSPPETTEADMLSADALPPGVKLVQGPVLTAMEGSLSTNIKLPAGYHYTAGANSRYNVMTVGGNKVSVSPQQGQLSCSTSSKISLHYKAAGDVAPNAALRFFAKIYFCQDESVCLFDDVCIEFAVQPKAAGDNAATFTYQVSAD